LVRQQAIIRALDSGLFIMTRCEKCGENHYDGGFIIFFFGSIFFIFPLLNPVWEGAPIVAMIFISLLGLGLMLVSGFIFKGKIHMGEGAS
jgi:hypothetical protein